MAFELDTGGCVVFQQADKREKLKAGTSGRGNRISEGEGIGKLHAVGGSQCACAEERWGRGRGVEPVTEVAGRVL